MQHSHSRQDIEANAESGLTFMAAVEYLHKFKPQFAIFENVLMAPWAKMVEYITGRITLSQFDVKKGVKTGMTTGDNKASHLDFSINDENQFVVDIVPAQYGVKAGAVVIGVIRCRPSERSERGRSNTRRGNH